MAKITKINYCTEERKKLINQENLELYNKYLKSSGLKNSEIIPTTLKTYQNSFTQFLVFLSEKYNNIGLYSPEFFENAVDIMEDFMNFCVEELKNHKKVINTKISAVSAFYLWSMKRRLIDRHPFDKKLDRMKGANDEKIIESHFLTEKQVQTIRQALLTNKEYDIQDQLIFSIMIDSANRVGAIHKLTISSLDLENMIFTNIREKRGYRVDVPFTEVTRELIQEWLELRKELDNLETDALFIIRHGDENKYKQMGYTTIQNRVKKMGKIIGLEYLHCHDLRKSTINSIYLSSGDLMLAAEYANHKGTEVTKLYIKPKSKTELRQRIKELSDQKNKE